MTIVAKDIPRLNFSLPSYHQDFLHSTSENHSLTAIMRLLSVNSLQLEMFHDVEDAPHYAILSHTWSEEEVTLQDLQRHDVAGMKGYKKIRGSCALAKSDGLDYVWIDTCCIDKTNSTELSEAINSMFRWYQYAKVCYAYLNDVTRQSAHSEENYTVLDNCRWFTRGWTLQELIAPRNVVFYDRSWEYMGRRKDFASQISRFTSIDQDLLQGGDKPVEWRLSSCSVAKRLSWAARRKTTRAEDLAYCLMGIFDIHMPLIYGEGLKKAFQRLQAEILRNNNDQSILAWSLQDRAIDYGSYEWETIEVDSSQEDNVFASHPKYFQSCGDVAAISPFETPLNLSSGGLGLQLKIFGNPEEDAVVWGVLACHQEDDFFQCIAIPISRQVSVLEGSGPISFVRRAGGSLRRIPLELIGSKPWLQVRLATKTVEHQRNAPQHVILEFDNLRRVEGGWTVVAAPYDRWNRSTLTMQFRHVRSEQQRGAFVLEGTLSNSQPISLVMLFRYEPQTGPRLLLRQGLLGGLSLLPRLAQYLEELESGTLEADWTTNCVYIAPDAFKARVQEENRLGKAIWAIRVEWIRSVRDRRFNPSAEQSTFVSGSIVGA